jgi:hypothetical protein
LAQDLAIYTAELLRRECMDQLTIFGLVSVGAMVLFYALEDRARGYTLAFAGACICGSIYGFRQGAWPFGVVEIVWAGIAVWRWWNKGRSRERKAA